MAENEGVVTRSKSRIRQQNSSATNHEEQARAKASKKSKETKGARPNRNSFPQDHYTMEVDLLSTCDDEASPMKQPKRRLNSRDINVPEGNFLPKEVRKRPSKTRTAKPTQSGRPAHPAMPTVSTQSCISVTSSSGYSSHVDLTASVVYFHESVQAARRRALEENPVSDDWEKFEGMTRVVKKEVKKTSKSLQIIYHDIHYLGSDDLILKYWEPSSPIHHVPISLVYDYPVPDDVPDIDLDQNSTRSNIYAKEIMEFVMVRENDFSLEANHMSKSPEVTARMRGVLMDWLLQVQTHEDLCNETLHLTVALVDQVLSLITLTMDKLQLVGITCLLIASKFSERFAPQIKVLCYLTEDTFTPNEVIKYELYLLYLLQFKLNRPMPTYFLDRLLQVFNADNKVSYLASYLLDLTITVLDMVPVLPSLKAAGAVYLSRWLMLDGVAPWNDALKFYSGYTEQELHDSDIIKNLAIMLCKATNSKFQGAVTKYKDDFGNISGHPRAKTPYIMDRCFETSNTLRCARLTARV